MSGATLNWTIGISLTKKHRPDDRFSGIHGPNNRFNHGSPPLMTLNFADTALSAGSFVPVTVTQ
jgi:hypothetical protein